MLTIKLSHSKFQVGSMDYKNLRVCVSPPQLKLPESNRAGVEV